METEATRPSVDRALAGRRRELAVLQSQLTAAAEGRAHVVLVVGQPGIGKTRLLDEVATRASLEGATVLRGGASESEGMPPYLPFLEAVGAYIRTADLDQLRAHASEGATTLASIFPELAVRLGELPSGHPLPLEQARLRLYEAMGTFVASIATPRPVVLLFDDLHWADAASLDLLCHVACRQSIAQLLIFGAYREGEAEGNPALARAVDYLNRHRLLTILTLSPLSGAELTELATAYLGSPIDSSIATLLHTHSEGNPFFAEELLRGWLEIGGLVLHGHQWAMTSALDPGTIPRGIVGAIHQRLARLSPDIVGHLQTAAIIGRAFDVALLAPVESTHADVLEARLLTASRAGLVGIDRTGTYAFSHDKIRECLYADVPPGRRQRAHHAIGRALESQGDSETVSHLAALAFHFSRSGDRAQGAMYSLRAAETALAVYAAREAVAHYLTALDLMGLHDARRGGTLLGMGKAALLADGLEEAASAYEAAHAWALQAGDRTNAARAALGLSSARARSGDIQKSIGALITAVDLLEDRLEPETVEALAWLAEEEALLGRFPEGMVHAERALEIARTLGNGLLEAKAYQQLGKLLARMNKIPAGLKLFERALVLITLSDDPREAIWCHMVMGFETLKAGEVRRCREISLACIEIARRCREPFWVHRAQAWLASVASLEGNWLEAEQLTAQVQPAEMMRHNETMEFVHRARGFMAFLRGDYEEAEQEFEAIATIHEHSLKELTRYRGLLGLVQLMAGKHHEAQAYMATQEALLEALPAGSTPTAPILNCLAIMAVTMGDGERAGRYYSSLVHFQGQLHWFLVDRVLAVIETLQGNWPAAESHLAAGAETAKREGLRPELALILVAQADLELARGGRESSLRARAKLGEALRRFQELGMAAEATRARKRLRELPRQPGGPDHPLYPAGLSPREVQILRLVAAGLSNRAIAQELALSEKTVATHLTAIFNKTATDNRAAATTFALRHGLA